jgi:hypothetical protein
MDCRPGCGACCIAPSITSPIPGMPQGKPAGVRCVQLGDDLRCLIFGRPERPSCCSGLQPSAEMCGEYRTQALHWLTRLDEATRPDANTLSQRARPAQGASNISVCGMPSSMYGTPTVSKPASA